MKLKFSRLKAHGSQSIFKIGGKKDHLIIEFFFTVTT